MTRTRRASIGLLILGLAACGSEPEGTALRSGRLSGAAKGWNVVLVSVDTQRVDRLSGYGYERRATSPRVDTLLLDSGVRFERAMSPRGATWPALASLLTGLYPTGHGVIRNGYGLPDGLPTLPLILSATGYQNGAFLNNMQRANHSGWDTFRYANGDDRRLVREALEWIRGLEPDRPFFLWTHLFGPHSPYHMAKLLDVIPGVDPEYDGPVKMGKVALDRILSQGIPLGEADLEQLDAYYDGAVLATDRSVGRLIDGLRTAPGAERTLFVYASDHGETLYEHNRYLYHACSAYQNVLHVPLSIVAPGLLEPGTVIDTVVELVDVLPTLLDLLGIDPLAEQHGASLVRLLERPDAGGERPAFSEYDDTAIRTVLSENWKLVVNPDAVEPVCVPGAPAFDFPIEEIELYDLGRDPGEARNVAAEHPEVVERLRQLIERRFTGLSDRGREQDIPEDLRRELEALGYVAN